MVNSLDSNKPVAWVEVASDGTILGVSLDKDDTSPFILRPLYTAPVAQPKNEPDVFNKARFEKSPCYICGYNGPGYYQSNVHKCAAIYHGQVAQPDDRAVFEAFALSEGFVDSAAAWKNKEAAQPDAEKVRKYEIDKLRGICAAAYQLAGLVGAPKRFLDALGDAASGDIGKRCDPKALLPVFLHECDEFSRQRNTEEVPTVEELWNAYQFGQISVDHTAKQVFCEVINPLLTKLGESQL